MKKSLDESFDRGFQKAAGKITARSLLNTIPKSTHSVGAGTRTAQGFGEFAKKAPSREAGKAVSAPATKMHGTTNGTSNRHTEYMRSIGAIGKGSKNDGNILKYKASGGKTQFDSISKDPKTKIAPTRGPLK